MKKLICGLIVLCMLAGSLFAGGGGQQAGGSGASGPVKLTYYEGLSRAAQGNKSFDTHFGRIELLKRTNVELEYISPPVGNETEHFNLMIASRDFPDIITYWWLTVPGGPAAYIEDQVIIKLNDVIDKWAPDVKVSLNKYSTARRESELDDGTMYMFPKIYTDPEFRLAWGPMFRRDLADKIPALQGTRFPEDMETLEEWEKILTIVKNSGLKADSGRNLIPLSFTPGNMVRVFITGAWGISGRFTQENGNPVYGPSDPRFFEYLTLMKRWYDLGLIDPEFAANTPRILDEKVLDNRVFAFTHNMGNGLTRYTGLARPSNPEFLLNVLKQPVLKKGDMPNLSDRTYDIQGCGAAISTACKNIETAARFLNYLYSEDGVILSNFGIEGETFVWDTSMRETTNLVTSTHRGYPRYTDKIMNNPDYSKDIALSVFLDAGLESYGLRMVEFLNQRDNLPEQVGSKGRALWAASDKNMIPAVLPTQEESSEFSRLMSEINTYVDEMTVKFIMGAEPLSRFNEFVQTQKRMGIDRALAIMRVQIGRYNQRP
jgi:putative aldouronate transport system substrate-binding protein